MQAMTAYHVFPSWQHLIETLAYERPPPRPPKYRPAPLAPTCYPPCPKRCGEPTSPRRKPKLELLVLRRGGWIVLIALAAMVASSWLYILAGAGMGTTAARMSSLEAALGVRLAEGGSAGRKMAAMATPTAWELGYALLMVAMMLPSAAQTILLHPKVDRRARGEDTPGGTLAPTAGFAGGNLPVWGAFSLAAAGLQWAFLSAGWLSRDMLNGTSTDFAVAILIAASRPYPITAP